MRNGPSLKEVSHPRYKWRVRWREGDKDCQKFYADGQKNVAKAFAQAKAIEIKNHGTKHEAITDPERIALVLFREAVAKLPAPKPTLQDCVNTYLAGLANQLAPISVSELVAKRIAAAEKKGVHQRTLRDLGGVDGSNGRLGAFARAFGDRQAAGVSAEEIEQWVAGHCATDSNRREVLVRLRGLFSHGVKRGYLRENPVSRLELPRPNHAKAKILTVKEAKALLQACPDHVLPAVAVQLFAGLRLAEVERLDWKDIDFERDSIKVTQRKGSGGRREKVRFAPLLPTLRNWLGGKRQTAGPVFPVALTGPRKGHASPQIYRTAFADARETAKLDGWDENTLRHTYGSYRLAALNDLERLRVEMGHTTSRTTAEHYVNAVRASEAVSFWAITPDRPEKRKVVPITSVKSA